MNRTIRKTAAFAAVILSVGAAAAFAANGPPLVGVTKSSMNGVKQAAGANGALKVNAVGNRQIKFGSVSCGKLSADLKMALCTGKPGAPGTPGAPGANGTVGSPGNNGGNGSNGDKGGSGKDGGKGDKGDKGDNGDTHYGIVNIIVKRGSAAASTWATYSTPLGSPVGDTTGGSFRFTCAPAATQPQLCTVSVSASVTAGGAKGVYPRLLIYKQDAIINASPTEDYCEYLDGPGNAVTTSATPVPLAYGGSADCGATEDGVLATPNDFGLITSNYVVGPGYYDVHSTFTFLP